LIVNSFCLRHVHGDGAYEAHQQHNQASSWMNCKLIY
jgi:hypothetical protein